MAERSGEGAPVAPPGWERWIAARLPRTLLVGLLLPWLLVLLRRWAASAGFAPAPESDLLYWDYAALGWSVFHVSVCVAIATGCWVVMVMKGPPRQADSYPPAGRSSPLKKGPDRPLP
ncbi:hypothetical protein [Pseudorhodoferax sp.]|uniref:hypothetical protein n=1 Tax=Pseudorhodoferax sp. TaxID=1993553 RepID=UPI002DD6266D|nr:hypothetical protein [Pseudorhodoferax sp.]